jgi:signal transduction histidine kinase
LCVFARRDVTRDPPFSRLDLVSCRNLLIATWFDDRKQKLSLFLPSDPVRVMADPVRLEQVAANLLANAAKYTAPSGEIVVVVGHADDHAIITVRDNGVGIALESMRSCSSCSSRPTLPSTGGREDWGSG